MVNSSQQQCRRRGVSRGVKILVNGTALLMQRAWQPRGINKGEEWMNSLDGIGQLIKGK